MTLVAFASFGGPTQDRRWRFFSSDTFLERQAVVQDFESPAPIDPIGSSALVSLSGGQDSVTCLYWALSHFKTVEAVAFDYGQRHKIELDCAARVAERAGVPLKLIPLNSLAVLGGNALTRADIELDAGAPDRLPSSFVPGRNILFMTLLAAWAWQRGIADLVTGVCQTDYSGYPDCRDQTMKALESCLSLGMDRKFRIHTPLMWLTKAQTVILARRLDGAYQALSDSHTCYEGQRPPCGQCPACQLRARGFAEAGFPDPLLTLEKA